MSAKLLKLSIIFILLWPVVGLGVPSHAVVFMYHRFGDDRFPSTNVTLEQFDAHLDYLARHDYKVWPLQRILRCLDEGRQLPDRVVAITIDDAYLTAYQNAYPRLKQRAWPFTVFVSSDPVDKGLPDFMTWEQMREMRDNGAAFAAHSASHAHLVARLKNESEAEWRERVHADIDQGQRRLQAELGGDANAGKLFAYPYGEYDQALTELLEDMGYTAFGQHSGAVGVHSDRRRLPRYPINEHYADLDEFARKAASLPLPVTAIDPGEPLVKENNPPRLRLTLAEGDYVTSGIACYASGQGRIETRFLEQSPPRFQVRARQAFATGRARYNCTAPAASGGRWYWYSHPWIIPPVGGGPGD